MPAGSPIARLTAVDMTPMETSFDSTYALARRSKIAQSNISNMEMGRQQIGRERAIVLARALKVHPAVILFPNYQLELESDKKKPKHRAA